MNDWCDEAGARRIGAALVSYWAARGMHVSVQYVEQPFTPAMRSGRYDVRSDMVNGLPRKVRLTQR